jgi:hypothetical protein
MSIRESVEGIVKNLTGEKLTDEIFREAAKGADEDIKFNNISFGRRTSFRHAAEVTAKVAMILIDINKKSTPASALRENNSLN